METIHVPNKEYRIPFVFRLAPHRLSSPVSRADLVNRNEASNIHWSQQETLTISFKKLLIWKTVVIESQITFFALPTALPQRSHLLNVKNCSGNCCNNVVHRIIDNFYKETHKLKSTATYKHNPLIIVIFPNSPLCI